jgi:shikimate kinase
VDNITLIGMPGSGKSTLGRLLAQDFGHRFVDSDEIIASLSGRTLQQIIDEKGEEEFLVIEEAALLSLKGNRKVFSPGGSCVFSPRAMEYLRAFSLVIFLDVSPEILEKRLKTTNLDMRGIVGLKSMSLQELFALRRPLYMKYSHLVVQLDDRPVRESLADLVRQITDYRGSNQ